MARDLIWDYRNASLSEPDRALCDYAVKLTLSPGSMEERDLEHLRGFGFTDEQLLIATQVISYFNYINRVADALGVDDEDWMAPSRDQWLEDKGRNYESILSG